MSDSNRGTENQEAGTVPLPANETVIPNEASVVNTQVQTEQPDPYQLRDLIAQEDMAHWAMWMFVAAIATFAITSIGTFFLAWQVMLTRRAVEDTSEATEEMRKANEIARQALIIQNRAWLTVDITPYKALRIDGDELRIGCDVTINNIGGGPALAVHIALKLSSIMRGMAWEQQRIITDELKKHPPSPVPGGTIYPHNPFVQKYDFPSTDNLFNWLNKDWGDGMERPPLFLCVIGCVQYRLPGSDEPHHTSFAYEIKRRQEPVKYLAADDLPLQPDQIGLFHIPFGGPGLID